MQNLIDKIKKAISLSQEAEKHLYSIGKVKSVEKGDILIRQGQAVNKTYFVTTGCLRSFCLDKNGKEHTLQFAIRDWWISDFIAIYNDELATLTVECIKDAELIEFNAIDLENIHSLFPEFEVFQRKNLERHVVSLHKRIINQLQLTAQERYDFFLQQYPDIEQYVPNYHIASYLGITQQSLSRVRAKKTR
ncbi:cAMP-binding domain of CRP or a regulatory subunit of cAMP-dependent protein kinases [Tenacibaculum sp. MAR_2009_124]|uniref:Crp/Fnr family transcriptional regulator n=1 Tax=Tenacibaculum sp. MAR_2009_124 TaxID=1250059 RepID=UPI00089D18F3|nr:Crp/Fnr family transcriptional regulator [Tenacibaculum sp. MAR_2009_124]SEC25824.1 cAMP-binding domain of CRP or a regulatory subunit of cAMP-dependent protein kinases [Tenacibaculum sp. MAR_2009_124]